MKGDRGFQRTGQETVCYQDHATLMDNCVDVLTNIRGEGRATELVPASRRDWVEIVLDRFDLHNLYDAVITSSDLEGASKPNPRTYTIAADQLGVQSEACLVVEDSPHGIDAAVRAEMYCIALRGAGNANADLSTADRIVESSAELQSTLFQMGVSNLDSET